MPGVVLKSLPAHYHPLTHVGHWSGTLISNWGEILPGRSPCGKSEVRTDVSSSSFTTTTEANKKETLCRMERFTFLHDSGNCTYWPIWNGRSELCPLSRKTVRFLLGMAGERQPSPSKGFVVDIRVHYSRIVTDKVAANFCWQNKGVLAFTGSLRLHCVASKGGPFRVVTRSAVGEAEVNTKRHWSKNEIDLLK